MTANVDKDGSQYVGIVDASSSPFGKGKKYFSDGALEYEGTYKQGKREGYGLAYYQSNGKLAFNGTFHNDIPNGPGSLYFEDEPEKVFLLAYSSNCVTNIFYFYMLF